MARLCAGGACRVLGIKEAVWRNCCLRGDNVERLEMDDEVLGFVKFDGWGEWLSAMYLRC